MTTDIINTELGLMASKDAPDESRNKRRADSFVALVESFHVATQEDYTLAAGELRSMKRAWDEMEEQRVSFTGPLNKVLDMLNGRFQPALKALKAAEAVLKGKMSAYLVEQERLARVEREKAEAIAAAERKRLADEAEAVRKKAEAEAAELARVERERVAEAARQQKMVDDAAALVKNKAARAKAEEAAALLRQKNEEAAADAQRLADEARDRSERQAAALETTAAVTIAQPTTVVVQKGRGISTPKRWVGEVTNKMALMKHIVEKRPDLIVLLDVNDAKLAALVKMMGEGTDLPGVMVKEVVGISVR